MFSRWMPPYQPAHPEASSTSIAILAVIGFALLWYLVAHPRAAAGAAVCGLLIAFARLHFNREQMRRGRARVGEDIGTFARAFDRQASTFDPWVVRAAWDALAPWTLLPDGTRLPLRPTDAIEDLGCVDDDLEEVIVHAASRARRHLEPASINGYEDRVVTVGDLVDFLARRPLTPVA